jgi:hypothetical protein
MIRISENSGRSLTNLFKEYHECVYWGQCEDSYRSQLLSEIKELLWTDHEYVEEQVKHYFNNLQWRDVQKDKEQLEGLLIGVQIYKINILINQNNLLYAYELLKEMPENEEINSLLKKMLTKIATNGDEDLISLAFREHSDLNPDFRSQVYNRAISSAIPSLAADIVISNGKIIPSDIKDNLVNVIVNGVGWEPAFHVLSRQGVSISGNDRKRLFNTMMTNGGSNVDFAHAALGGIDKIPKIYTRELKRILKKGHIENEEIYFWLIRNGFCKIGIKKLLQKMEITTKTDIELLPVWNEMMGYYEGLSLDKCAAYSLLKLIPLVCEFWSYRKFPEGIRIDRDISFWGGSMSIRIVATTSDIIYTRNLEIRRVEPIKYRCCLSWQNTYEYNTPSLSRIQGNHFRSFYDALK